MRCGMTAQSFDGSDVVLAPGSWLVALEYITPVLHGTVPYRTVGDTKRAVFWVRD